VTPKEWASVKDLFEEARGRPESERAGFVREKAGGNGAVAREVLSLLEAHEGAGEFLGSPTATRADADAFQVPQPKRVGPYEVLRELGLGGMGTVYLAEQVGPDFRRPVAVKVIRHGFSTSLFVRRFQNERRILAGLSHPNIAALLDGGTTEDGLPYFAMEYVAGTPLNEYCDARRFSTAQRLVLFRTICGAVQYAHQNLVVHRDLKPGNILVTQEGVPKLLDFGLAKVLEPGPDAAPEETATDMRIFTPAYASPEQVKGEPITTASDVYSLGALLYVLLTGKRPYRVATGASDEMARAVVEQEPTRPSLAVLPDSRLSRSLAGDVDTIVLKAMHKDPRRRYGSAEQLSADIGRHLEGRPVSARRDSRAYRIGKFVRRHAVAVTAAALVVVAVAGGVAATLWQARRAAEKEALAVRRFNDVRKLANAYLFEFHDAIKDLAGSTPARQLLVRRALEYLGPLARESGDDPDLLNEVAEAYMRIGDVQGGVGIANLGDTKGALESYLAALGIRERLVVARPRSVAGRQALAEALQRASDLQTGTDATRGIERAIGVLETLVAEEPKSVGLRLSLVSANSTLGQRLEIDGRPERAVEVFRRMGALCEGVVADDPKNLRARRGVAIARMQIGQTYQAMDKSAEALASYRSALPLWDALVAENPENGNLKRDYSIVLAEVSLACQGLRNDESVETGLRAIALRETLAAADPNDADIRIFLAESYANVGKTLALAGRIEEGLADIRKAIGMCRDLLRKDPENNLIPEALCIAYANLGDLHREIAQKAKGPAATSEWRLAREAYVGERDTLLGLKAAGKLPEQRMKAIDEAARKIALCDKALGRGKT
jgi:non-specific serine/threonine protein kinase/serine/threonine-protein kinase